MAQSIEHDNGQPERQRLATAVRQSDVALDAFRAQRREFMEHFAGPRYGAKRDWRQPLNLIYSLVCTLEPALAMMNLKCLATCPVIENRWFASTFASVVSRVLYKGQVATTVRELIRAAFYSIGVAKVGHDPGGKVPYFVDRISLDDWVIDRRCRSYSPGGYAFEGHRFRMNFEEAMDSDLFDPNARREIERIGKANMRHPEDRAETIGIGATQAGSDQFEPSIELIELYLPRTNRIVWLPGDLSTSGDDYLREFDWYGPDTGPYTHLGFSMLNDNVMPIPIVSVIFDLYLLENRLASKTARQAEIQKSIVTVDAANAKDEESVRQSQDGQIVRAPGLKAEVLNIGGANEKGYQAIGFFQDWYSRISGNSDLLGGQTASSKTLGQDQMLMGNASVRVNDYRNMVNSVVEEITQKLAWFIWHDTDTTFRTTRKLQGGVEVPVQWRPEDRQGEYEDYDITISTHARTADGPDQKLERLTHWLQTIVLPLMPAAAAMGKYPNMDEIVNRSAELHDIDELGDMWIEGPPQQMAPSHQQPQQDKSGGSVPQAAPSMGRQPPSAIDRLAVPSESTK